MGSYVPSTGTQREEMLRAVGVSSTRDLFRDCLLYTSSRR